MSTSIMQLHIEWIFDLASLCLCLCLIRIDSIRTVNDKIWFNI